MPFWKIAAFDHESPGERVLDEGFVVIIPESGGLVTSSSTLDRTALLELMGNGCVVLLSCCGVGVEGVTIGAPGTGRGATMGVLGLTTGEAGRVPVSTDTSCRLTVSAEDMGKLG